MRLWVHIIWNRTNRGHVLATSGKRENDTFEQLLHQYGERVLGYAWYLYVNSKPCAYHLEPVEIVNKWTSPKGHTFVDKHEDGSSVTRFPLAAFLAVHEGYIVKATMDITAFDDLPEEDRKKIMQGATSDFGTGGHGDVAYRLRFCHQARQQIVKGLKQKWSEKDDANW